MRDAFWMTKSIIGFLLLLLAGPLAADEAMVVVTYNIRQDTASDTGGKDWQARKNALTGYLRAGNFSIIGLQEARHNQLLDVDRALPAHVSTGVGRDDGKTRGEYSPILFNTRHWKLDPQQHGTFWLSDTPDVVRSMTWGNRFPRICTWARLIGLEGSAKGRAIYVFNTHWDHQSQPSRLKSAKLILEKIASRTNRQEPVILMGDFNADTKNPAIKTLLDSGVVVDHGGQQKRSGSRWKPDLAAGLRIDHVFTSPSFQTAAPTVESNPGVQGLSASDHHPVVLRTKMPSVTK
jgi:endonuclease/exonuclease/phosphatase family metal-dependent hydrolase